MRKRFPYRFHALSPTLHAFLVVAAMAAEDVSPRTMGPVVADFRAGTADWRAINDDVMGGISRSRLRPTPEHTAVFEGKVSLENNGGFASVRVALGQIDLSSFEGLSVRVRGDGLAYQIRLRTHESIDGIAYRAALPPIATEWGVVRIPFSAFAPTYRGRRPSGAPPLDTHAVTQLGFLIGEGQSGSFSLEIDWVRGYGCEPRSKIPAE